MPSVVSLQYAHLWEGCELTSLQKGGCFPTRPMGQEGVTFTEHLLGTGTLTHLSPSPHSHPLAQELEFSLARGGPNLKQDVTLPRSRGSVLELGLPLQPAASTPPWLRNLSPYGEGCAQPAVTADACASIGGTQPPSAAGRAKQALSVVCKSTRG